MSFQLYCLGRRRAWRYVVHICYWLWLTRWLIGRCLSCDYLCFLVDTLIDRKDNDWGWFRDCFGWLSGLIQVCFGQHIGTIIGSNTIRNVMGLLIECLMLWLEETEIIGGNQQIWMIHRNRYGLSCIVIMLDLWLILVERCHLKLTVILIGICLETCYRYGQLFVL